MTVFIFDYFYTRTLLNDSKDTAILAQAITGNISQDPQGRDLPGGHEREIYENALAYTDHSMAPPFSYRNRMGEQVSLQSLLGKYVYYRCLGDLVRPLARRNSRHLKAIYWFRRLIKNKNI